MEMIGDCKVVAEEEDKSEGRAKDQKKEECYGVREEIRHALSGRARKELDVSLKQRRKKDKETYLFIIVESNENENNRETRRGRQDLRWFGHVTRSRLF